MVPAVYDGGDFGGAKLAIISRGRVLTLLRDDRPDIPFPAFWDLPGGGREGDETPTQCALRELNEEFGLRLDPALIKRTWECAPIGPGQMATWFMGAEFAALKPALITFGDEGQKWLLMPVRQFLMHPQAVPHMAERLAVWLKTRQ